MRGRSSAVSAALELSDQPCSAAVVVARIYIQIYIQNGTNLVYILTLSVMSVTLLMFRYSEPVRFRVAHKRDDGL